MRPSRSSTRELVLVGGGHSHVQVLTRLAMRPIPDCEVTLVVDTPIAVYSGMVPGFLAGQYRREELEIDVRPLARRAGFRVITRAAVGVDPARKRVLLQDRPSIPYDVVSFDIGSTVAGLQTPGVREHALSTRPIGRFVQRFEGRVDAELSHRPGIAVVGGGAGGVEVAFTLEARLAARGLDPSVTLIHAGQRVLEGSSRRLVGRVEGAAHRRGIDIRYGRRVVEVAEGWVRLDDESELPSDLVVWVTGAVAPPLFRDSGLACDERGFLWIRDTLQSQDDDDLFAVGDCATLLENPTPKAGVYAVRQGPILTENLRARLLRRPLRSYRPQTDFLALLNLGDGTAIGGKWGLAAEGDWVMRLKDRIDRRFMERFQVLAADGRPRPRFDRPMPGSDDEPMLCGGCAAKLGHSSLQRALARLPVSPTDPTVRLGQDQADDAVAVSLDEGETILVSSIDAFPAFTDDPWLVGRVAAVNAMSDVWAKGVAPRHALALVSLPELEPRPAAEETLYQVLAGIRAALDPEGVTLLGGHTSTAGALMVGLQVQGWVPGDRSLLGQDGLQPGDHLLLTKPLGTGVLFHADMRGAARGPWIDSALSWMARPNACGRQLPELGASAVTDVTGFGLAGHLLTLLEASDLSARLELEALPVLPGAAELLRRGERSTFHTENRHFAEQIELDLAGRERLGWALLFDPQTSGGLLVGAPASALGPIRHHLLERGDLAVEIGRVEDRRFDGKRIVIP